MTANGDDSGKGLLDMQIMNVFEEQEDKFSFPITSQKEARDFVRLLNRQGCTYDVISKEVNEDEESFRDWRLGGGRVEIGKHVIERINKPISDTIFSDSEMDEKDRRNSLRDFYQFSFEEDEVPGTPKSKNVNRSDAQSKTIAIRENFYTAQNSNGLSKLISTSIQLPATSTSDPKNLQAFNDKSSLTVKNTSKTEVNSLSVVENLDSISMPKENELKLSSPTSRNPPPNSQPPETRQTRAIEPRVSSPTARCQNSTTKSSQGTESLSEKTSHQITKTQLDCSKSPVKNSTATAETAVPKFADRITRLETSATSKASLFSSNRVSSPPTNLTTAKIPGQTSTSRSSSTVSSPTSTTAGSAIKSPTESTSGDDPERPPSPVTTSPYYKPLTVNFKLEEIEPMLNYNSDDQEELKKNFGPNDVPGFIYVFSDIPGPSMSVGKSTKFRTKIGVSRDPLKRLQQAMLFNPDIRMLASISISSMKNCSMLLKESLKPYLMRGRLDWYWANLNAVFGAVDNVVQKFR